MHTFCHKHQKKLFVEAEGLYSGQFFYCGKNEGSSNALSRERENQTFRLGSRPRRDCGHGKI